jgi:hypothetical protein
MTTRYLSPGLAAAETIDRNAPGQVRQPDVERGAPWPKPSPGRRHFSVLCYRNWCDHDFKCRDIAAMTGGTGPLPDLPVRQCPMPATCEHECHDDGRAEQVSRYREAMPAPSNKRNRWRVYGPGDDYQDRTSENKAYELVRTLTKAGVTVSVYVWGNGRWVHFGDVLPVGVAR